MVAININESIRNFVIDIFMLNSNAKETAKKVRKHFKFSKKNLENIKNKDIFEKKEEKLCTIFFKSQEIRNEIAHSLGKKTKIAIYITKNILLKIIDSCLDSIKNLYVISDKTIKIIICITTV